MAFVKAVAGNSTERFFPPKLEWLQAWATLFRNSRTFSNYLGYVRVGCLVVKAGTEIFEHPAVVRAKHSIEKAVLFTAREKLWIRRQRVEALLSWAQKHPAYLPFAHLFLAGYVFMLRIPSEALPMVVAAGEAQITSQSVICIKGDELILVLKRRKNKIAGSRLVRKCWCRECPRTCPVHVLGKFVQASGHGK